MPKLAIVNTHPIQYYSPYYRKLASTETLDTHVFYSWRGALDTAYDPGFQQNVSWDIPLLEGYEYTFVENTAPDPGTHHFRGIVAPDLIPTVEAWNPDALLVFGWNYQTHLRALWHFHGRLPILFRGDSTLLNESPGPRKWARRLWLRWVYQFVDVALYVGENNRAYYEAHGLDCNQLAWVPHAVDNDRFADATDADQKAQSWRKDLGISEDASVVLFAGKLQPVKAPEVLLDAFLQRASSTDHLIIVGDGPLEDVLRQKASGHPRVHFLGFQNQSRMPVVYRLGDVFVLPSRSETWGLSVNEAMACARAVLVTDQVGCAPDLVDATNGAVVPANDPSGLQKALDDLLQNPERLAVMGRRSRERIADWSMETAASRTQAIVRSTVSHSR
jgi:glycosyltransferase involved in cell wall biosynthesis